MALSIIAAGLKPAAVQSGAAALQTAAQTPQFTDAPKAHAGEARKLGEGGSFQRNLLGALQAASR